MRVATLVFLISLGGLVGLADLGRLPDPILAIYGFPGGDDLGHFGLAAVGAFLLERWLRSSAPLSRRFAPGAAALAFGVLLTIEEVSQIWNAHRVCDPCDLAATWIGVAAGLGWAHRASRASRASRAASQRRRAPGTSSGVGPKRISPR